jgi:hypothetical protein
MLTCNNNNNNNMPLLCYIVKHFLCIPPVLVVWWQITNQTEAFATDYSSNSTLALSNVQKQLNSVQTGCMVPWMEDQATARTLPSLDSTDKC